MHNVVQHTHTRTAGHLLNTVLFQTMQHQLNHVHVHLKNELISSPAPSPHSNLRPTSDSLSLLQHCMSTSENARLGPQTAPWRPEKQDCVLRSEGDQQRCRGKLSRGRTWVLAYYGATSACVKGGADSLALRAEQAGTDEVMAWGSSEVQDRSAMHLAAHTRSMATSAAHISGDAHHRASHTARRHPSNRIYQTHTHTRCAIHVYGKVDL